MTTIGYATLQIVPSLKGVSDSINKQLASSDMGRAAGKKLGSNLADGAEGQVKSRLSERLGAQVGSVVGKGIGAGIKLGIAGGAAAAAAAVGGIGVALSKGFDRLKSIDQAKFKLQALGNSAADVQTIMDNALASVKGTAFGLQDAATAAASAVAAGIKPGEQLTKYLGEVGDAAAVAGVNFTDMGSIFNKIQTSNKAYTDDLNQLADKGLPIFTWLQKEYGVTADKLTEMVEKGEVDSAHFQDAIDKNIGGAAQKMGQSFDGAVDNMEASIARLGANFITAILGGDPSNALAGPTEAIGNLTTKFDEISVWVNAHSGEIRAFFLDIKDYAIQAAGAVKSIGEFLLEHRGILEATAVAWVGWKAISATASVLGAVRGISGALGGIGPAAAAAGEAGAAGLAPLLSALGGLPALFAGAAAFGAGIGPILNAGPDARNQKKWDDFNNAQRENAAKNRVPATIGGVGTGTGTGPSIGPPLVVQPPPSNAGSSTPKNPLLFPYGHSTGGQVKGPGSSTSDSIPAWLSDDEFVVNADATKKNLPLLEAINSGVTLPASLSGLSSFGLDGLGKGVGTTGSGSDLSVFGKAAGSAVSGQVASLLGVAGIDGAPPFLQAASKLLGGISIGGSSPVSAAGVSGGAIPPDDAGNMHGTRAGQFPGGAGPTYIINARDTEDALVRTQRFQDQRTASKLSSYGG